MATITLAKALRLKNRLVGRIGEAEGDISYNNCVIDGAERGVDPAKTMELRAAFVDALIDLKIKIQTANLPVLGSIYLLAECKSGIKFTGTIDTRSGATLEFRGEKVVNRTSIISTVEVAKMVRRSTIQIEQLQEELDRFNHETTIEIDDEILDLVDSNIGEVDVADKVDAV